MTISNETVIKKMMEQLQLAKECVDDHPAMINHISNIKLFCELILDEYEGKLEGLKPETLTYKNTVKKVYTDKKITSNEIDEDGTSIFDF